jgi:hypothetical protein
MKHTVSHLTSVNEKVKLDYRNVVTKTLDPKEMDTIKPFARVY